VVAGVIVAGAAWLLARAFRSVDLGATLHAVLRIGALAPLALLPFVGGMALDAAGMRVLLGLMGRSVPWTRILPIRIATEALHVTAPAGFLVADSATAKLLDLHFTVPLREGAMLAVARKWLVMRAHAVYLALGALCGAAALGAASHRYLGGGWLPWAIGACALVPLTLSIVVGQGIRGGAMATRVQQALFALPWPALQKQMAHWREGAVAVDARLACMGRARASTSIAALAFLGCWLFESLDTAVILRLVGGPPSFAFALASEVGISMLRSMGNVAPAGLGVQDAGYATLLPAIGMSPDAAAAFVLVKRAKELVWIGIGYALLAALRRPESVKDAQAGVTRLVRDPVARWLPRVVARWLPRDA
jgi:lysylphosphatidylglycerol synthase-like protein